jgi:hypothetical protein
LKVKKGLFIALDPQQKECMVTKSVASVSKVGPSLTPFLQKLHLLDKYFIKNFQIKFNENSINGSVADTM